MIRAGERISTPPCRIDVSSAKSSYTPELRKNIRTLAAVASRLCKDQTAGSVNSQASLDLVRAFWELQAISPLFNDAKASMLRGEKQEFFHFIPVISVNNAFVSVDTTFASLNGGMNKPMLVIAPDMEKLKEELWTIYKMSFFSDDYRVTVPYMRTSFLQQRASIYRKYVEGLD